MWTDCSNARIEGEGLVLSKTSIFRGLAAIDESRTWVTQLIVILLQQY